MQTMDSDQSVFPEDNYNKRGTSWGGRNQTQTCTKSQSVLAGTVINGLIINMVLTGDPVDLFKNISMDVLGFFGCVWNSP